MTAPLAPARVCSRCRLRPASGKHAWCTRCKKGRGGPPAAEARMRPRRNAELNGGVRSPGSAEYGPGTGRGVVGIVGAPKTQLAGGNNQHEGNRALACTDGQAPANGNAVPRSGQQDAVGDATTHAATLPASLSLTAADLVSNATPAPPTGARMQMENAAIITTQDDTAIPPRPSDDSFPPALVGFVPLIPSPKKGERPISRVFEIVALPKSRETALSVPEDGARERCSTPKVHAISPRLALCFACWRRDFANRLTNNHERGDTASCDSTDLEPFQGGRSTRCRRCGSAGSLAVMTAPHQIGRWV